MAIVLFNKTDEYAKCKKCFAIIKASGFSTKSLMTHLIPKHNIHVKSCMESTTSEPKSKVAKICNFQKRPRINWRSHCQGRTEPTLSFGKAWKILHLPPPPPPPPPPPKINYLMKKDFTKFITSSLRTICHEGCTNFSFMSLFWVFWGQIHL